MTSWPRLIPKGWGKRGRRVAMDLVALPYHGTRGRGPSRRGLPQQSQDVAPPTFSPMPRPMPWSGAVATPWRMCRVRAKQTMDHVVRTLLARLVTLGIRIKLLLLDRGFYSVRVIQDLITC